MRGRSDFRGISLKLQKRSVHVSPASTGVVFEAVKGKFPGSTVSALRQRVLGGQAARRVLPCKGAVGWERICAGGSKAEPRYALLPGERNLEVQIQSAPRKRFLKERN